ncbi:MAG: CotH kinase family protein [Synergistaceae bacterium]|nr:CotH kinase family protein [Synergistaceae bacterium]
MPKYDDRTLRGWPLPHRQNKLSDDADRLREALTTIDANITEIEGNLQSVEDVNEFLSTRMEVIVGQATEDTEILDARVDAEGNVHPNLGHNVRSIHGGLLQVVSDIRYGIQEFQGLLHQFSALAEAQIQDELNAQDANERRKAELAQESLTRLLQDDGLQSQINAASEAIMRTAVTLRELSERRKAELTREESSRISTDDSLQREINALAEAFLRDALTLSEALERRRDALRQEIQARIAGDTALQEQITRNAEKIQQESERRAEKDAEIHEALDVLNEGVALRKSEIDAETQARAEGDDGIARQANANAEGILQTALNVQDLNARRKADLLREEQARIAGDIALQELIDKTAEASIENALGIHQEAQQRRKSDERIEALRDETDRRIEIDAYHQLQIDEAIHAILQNSLALSEALARRRAALIREEQSRAEEDANLQGQIDTNATANMQNAMNIQQEAEHRRKLLELIAAETQERERQIQNVRSEIGELYEVPLPGLHEELGELQRQTDANAEANIWTALSLHDGLARHTAALTQETQSRVAEDAGTQRQINANAEGILQTALNLSEAFSRYREALTQEARARVEEDTNIQAQTDSNAVAALELAANLSAEAEKCRALGQAIAGLKSPIDWSTAESLAIREPRCAIVNFTGLSSMPTTKTADIPAFMEFWDMQGNFFRKPIVCSAQGSSSLGYVKKNVKFDLLNDDGSKFNLKIGNWVVQDGFHLKAYYTDFFRGVAVTSYKFWDEVMRYNGLDKDRPYKRAMIDASEIQPSGTSLNNPDDMTLQLDNGALCHPDGFPCIVYLNGEFYGVYSWQIKKQRKNYRMDKSTVEHIHLDGSLYTQYFWNGAINWTVFEIRNPNKLYTMDGKKYDGDAPKELIDETSEKYDASNKDHVRSAKVKRYIQSFVERFGELKQLYTAYRANPSDETLAAVKAAYEELFDWENQRDYLIFSDVIKNSDGFGKNWQWTTYDGVKWYVNAYDLDMSYGGHWQGTQITPPLTGHITTSTALPTGYVALLYKDELEARYRELRDAGIISVSNILLKLENWTARIGVGNYELEFERWPNSPCILNYTDSIYRVKRWLEVEIANMDKVYRYSTDTQPEIAEADDTEPLIRAEQDTGILRQVNALAEADMRSELNHALLNAERRREEAQERAIRDEQDAGLQAQINSLAEATMWRLVNEHDMRLSISEAMQQIKEFPSRPATDDEFDEMLDELYND